MTTSTAQRTGGTHSGLHRVLDALNDHGCSPNHKGGYYSARCPSHDDHNPSLSIQHVEPRVGETGGRARVRCHAGCDEINVLAAIGLELADLYDEPLPNSARHSVRDFPYLSASRRLVGVIQREEPKTFRPLTHDSKGWQRKSSDQLKSTPYRLPGVVTAVDQGHPVWIVEGERDADTLNDLGVAATCNAGGAGKWTDAHAHWLRGAHVVVCQDRDEPGRKHAEKVMATLVGIAATVRLVEPADGKDITDHLTAGHSLEDVVDIPTGAEDTAPVKHQRLTTGGSWIYDAPDVIPAIWGRDDEVLWSEGEPLMITGPTGVGKTTLGAQVIFARLGFQKTVLGYPVKQGRRVLYLAMDRPKQIQRALARLMRTADRTELDDRLVVWPGPPPLDLARNPTMLLELCQEADADTVVIDSLKDAAMKLSDEDTGQGMNMAMQLCVANGIEVLVYHHQRKSGGNGGLNKPSTLADVYGSMHLTAGCGSVILLWGAGGDPVVELSHLKQPADTIGPMKLVHDHTAGTTSIFHSEDVLEILLHGPKSAREVAVAMFGDNPKDAEVERARRKLEKLVTQGVATRLGDHTSGGAGRSGKGGGSGTMYAVAARDLDSTDRATRPTNDLDIGPRSVHENSISAGRSVHGTNRTPEVHASVHALHDSDVSAGRSVHASVHALHAASVHVSPPSLREGERGRGPIEDDDWVLAQLTHRPQPVGAIAGQAGADPFVVQAALERLTAAGRITTQEPGHGPRTWSLPERDLDQWPTIPRANQD